MFANFLIFQVVHSERNPLKLKTKQFEISTDVEVLYFLTFDFTSTEIILKQVLHTFVNHINTIL